MLIDLIFGLFLKVDTIPPKTRCGCLGFSHSPSSFQMIVSLGGGNPPAFLSARVAALHTWKRSLLCMKTIVTKVRVSEVVQSLIVKDFEEISSVADFCDRYVLFKLSCN
ncbi:hypothetical protein HA466_0238580 [Hirschfeldia incana]|nr:hypothetical protein HA466_0238580 [Hirschfeldia incana]